MEGVGNTASQGVRHLAGALEGRPQAAGLAGTAPLAPVEGRSTGKAAMVGLAEMAAGSAAAVAVAVLAGLARQRKDRMGGWAALVLPPLPLSAAALGVA